MLTLLTVALAHNLQALTLPARESRADTVVIDSFDSLTRWRTNPSEGVEVSIHSDRGPRGNAMRVDFDFHGRTGYWIVHRDVDLDLPPNYQFSFALRADAAPNNLEFKLVDHDGASVFWWRQRDFVFPRDWRTMSRRKGEICYAWGGPARPYYNLHRLSAIEFAISTGSGGKGSVWIDDLTITPLEIESPFTFTAAQQSNPLIGTWESEPNPRATGARLDFEADGSFRSVVGVMAPFTYSVDKNQLSTVFSGAASPPAKFTNSIRIAGDTLFQSGFSFFGSDIAMRRLGSSRSKADIRGVWTLQDSSGVRMFVGFDDQGNAELRVPSNSCSGSWTTVSPGRFRISLNGEIVEREYSIANDVLTLKADGHDMNYRRRTHTIQ